MNYTENDFTPWFDGKVKPACPGVYQQKTHGGTIGYQYWDGNRWYRWSTTPTSAALSYQAGAAAGLTYQNDPWRGLKNNPSKKILDCSSYNRTN